MTQTGDLNQDGRLDGKDVALLKGLLQMDPRISEHLSAEDIALLDINHDGHIDQNDLTALYDKIFAASANLSPDTNEKLAHLRNKINT